MQELFRQPKKFGNKPLLMLLRKNQKEDSFFLFCPDKSHKRAVDRNKTKRILRDLVRRHIHSIPKGYDIALIAQFEFSKCSPDKRYALFQNLFQFPK
ncbi:ribonuclease P protein component [Leptospira ryugenii]|uniref:ribonuclease P protein component n=1 Tax=Leptospira ryugenii TaxID=1917863 RepID=UPI000D596EDF|nr:ribonuclease P protein component [Leptospira ryugenii]